MSLRLRTVPASEGLQWARAGLRLFARRPGGLGGMFATWLFVMLLLTLVPVIGGPLSLGLMPIASLAFVLAAVRVQNGQPVHVGQFIEPFRSTPGQRRALLTLAGVYALGALLATVLAHWIDGGAFAAFMDQMAQAKTPEAQAAVVSQLTLRTALLPLTMLGFMAVVNVPLWHAPMLVHFDGQRAFQAMFSSTLAVWQTRAAMAVYMGAWAAVTLGGALVGTLIVALLGLESLAPMLLIPLGLSMSAAFNVSVWFTFDGTFERSPAKG